MINVTKVYLPDREKYLSYVNEIFDSGHLTNNGPFVQKLEKRLEEFLDVRNVILVSNGTAALELAYKALGLSGKVVTTPFSFAATTTSLVYSGLQPVFADIDPETFNIDPEKIAQKIDGETRAIVPVHVFGNACDVESIGEIAREKDLKVVYDAAHAFDVRFKDRSLLSFGDISTLSFHATKLFHTIEGGAVITQNDDLAEKIRKMRNFGMADSEHIPYAGTNAKMNEFEAAMGLCLLDEIGTIIQKRREVTERYEKSLEGIVEYQRHHPKATRNYSYFPVLFENETIMKRILQALGENDIHPRRYFYPSLDTLPFVTSDETMEISRSVAERILCLPLYPDLETKDIEKISSIIRRQLEPNT